MKQGRDVPSINGQGQLNAKFNKWQIFYRILSLMRENLARINLSLSDLSDDYEETWSESENGDSKTKGNAGRRGVPLPLCAR